MTPSPTPTRKLIIMAVAFVVLLGAAAALLLAPPSPEDAVRNEIAFTIEDFEDGDNEAFLQHFEFPISLIVNGEQHQYGVTEIQTELDSFRQRVARIRIEPERYDITMNQARDGAEVVVPFRWSARSPYEGLAGRSRFSNASGEPDVATLTMKKLADEWRIIKVHLRILGR